MKDRQADFIKIAAVLTAIPRWTGALLLAEGVGIPLDWLWWWRIVTALLSVGMACVEAFAVSYILSAWRNQHDKSSAKLPVIALVSLAVFTVVLAPYIAGNARGITLDNVLGDGWLWWTWSIAVASSTGIIVAGVGYAEKTRLVAPKNDIDDKSRHDAPKNDTVSKDAFVTAYRANGHVSVAALAHSMGVNVRTAQRWVVQTEERLQ